MALWKLLNFTLLDLDEKHIYYIIEALLLRILEVLLAISLEHNSTFSELLDNCHPINGILGNLIC